MSTLPTLIDDIEVPIDPGNNKETSASDTNDDRSSDGATESDLDSDDDRSSDRATESDLDSDRDQAVISNEEMASVRKEASPVEQASEWREIPSANASNYRARKRRRRSPSTSSSSSNGERHRLKGNRRQKTTKLPPYSEFGTYDEADRLREFRDWMVFVNAAIRFALD